MSIDKLIVELDKDKRNLNNIQSLSGKILNDYIGVSKAYLDLLETVSTDQQKTECITNIIKQIMNNIMAMQNLQMQSESSPCIQENLDKITGEILRGECTINELIEKFEDLSN